MRALWIAVCAAGVAACGGAGSGDGFSARTEGVIDVPLDGTAALCEQGRGMLLTLADADREATLIFGRFARGRPPPGAHPVLAPEAAQASGDGAMFVAPIYFVSAKAVRVAQVTGGEVVFEEGAGDEWRGSFRLRVSYNAVGGAGPREEGQVAGAFSAKPGGACPAPA